MGMLRHRGFTLIELLVVFAIAALLVSVVPFAFGRMQESVQYRNVVRLMMSDLRTARVLAQEYGADTRFRVDLSTRRFGLDGRTPQVIPPELTVSATVAGQELTQGQVAAIRFLPSGGATGGSIDIRRASGGGTRVRVDWLSGRVTAESLTP